jgi:hypothetical protein
MQDVQLEKINHANSCSYVKKQCIWYVLAITENQKNMCVLQKAEANAAELDSQERGLKERLKIQTDKELSEKLVADKADAIARKMQELADQADKVS